MQPAAPAQVVVANSAAATTESLLKRAFLFLEDGNWQSADEYAEKVLDIAPENAEAYLSKAMTELKVKTRAALTDAPGLEKNTNTTKALRFGSEMLKKELNSYIESTHKAEEKRRIAENEQRKAEEERRLAEEELRKEEEKKRKEAEEKKEIETQIMADKVIAAIHEKKYGNASDALQQRLAAMQEEVETLNIVIREFDEVSKRISEQNAVLDALLNQETKLKTQRESLGLFAGKEKKRIDEELAQLAPQSAQAKVAVESLFQRLGGFQTKQQAEQALEIAKKTVKDLTIQIKNAQEQANEAYTLEQAVEIMETNADVLNKVPHGLFLCDVYGKRGTVHFGHYPQKSSTDQSLIEWIVLNRDDNKLFLLSKYGLDCQKYNKEDTPVTWETCTLRKWLNSDFISVAFTKEEQSCIMRTLVRADASPEYKTFPCNDTTDKIFLLGYNEFKAFDLEKCHSTAFALKKGVYESDIGCIWWLRSPGYRQNCAAYVLGSGAVSFGSRYTNDSVTETNISIRPAMWIDLNSLQF